MANRQDILRALTTFFFRMPDRNSNSSIPSPSIVKLL
jgi:hypothetical protein